MAPERSRCNVRLLLRLRPQVSISEFAVMKIAAVTYPKCFYPNLESPGDNSADHSIIGRQHIEDKPARDTPMSDNHEQVIQQDVLYIILR